MEAGCARFQIRGRSGDLAEGENTDSGHVGAQFLSQGRRDGGDQFLTVGSVFCCRNGGGSGLDRRSGAALGADDLAP